MLAGRRPDPGPAGGRAGARRHRRRGAPAHGLRRAHPRRGAARPWPARGCRRRRGGDAPRGGAGPARRPAHWDVAPTSAHPDRARRRPGLRRPGGGAGRRHVGPPHRDPAGRVGNRAGRPAAHWRAQRARPASRRQAAGCVRAGRRLRRRARVGRRAGRRHRRRRRADHADDRLRPVERRPAGAPVGGAGRRLGQVGGGRLAGGGTGRTRPADLGAVGRRAPGRRRHDPPGGAGGAGGRAGRRGAGPRVRCAPCWRGARRGAAASCWTEWSTRRSGRRSCSA